MIRYILAAMILPMLFATGAIAGDSPKERGKYLVQISGCGECHTPGNFFGHPDTARFLAGSDVGFAIPGMGVFVGPNLTPDNDTGLGKWTSQQIITAFTAGIRPDGRVLAASMPWRGYANLTKQDAEAIATYLKSLQPIRHKAPGPFGPTEKPNVFVMSVQPARVYASGLATR